MPKERYDEYSQIIKSFKKKTPQQIKDEKKAKQKELKTEYIQHKRDKQKTNEEVREFVEKNNIIDNVRKMSDEKLLDEYEGCLEYFNSDEAEKGRTQQAKQEAVLHIQKEELDKRGILEDIQKVAELNQKMESAAAKARAESMTDSLDVKYPKRGDTEKKPTKTFVQLELNRRGKLETIKENDLER